MVTAVAWVTAVDWVPSLPGELLYATGMTKKTNKKQTNKKKTTKKKHEYLPIQSYNYLNLVNLCKWSEELKTTV